MLVNGLDFIPKRQLEGELEATVVIAQFDSNIRVVWIVSLLLQIQHSATSVSTASDSHGHAASCAPDPNSPQAP